MISLVLYAAYVLKRGIKRLFICLKKKSVFVISLHSIRREELYNTEVLGFMETSVRLSHNKCLSQQLFLLSVPFLLTLLPSDPYCLLFSVKALTGHRSCPVTDVAQLMVKSQMSGIEGSGPAGRRTQLSLSCSDTVVTGESHLVTS